MLRLSLTVGVLCAVIAAHFVSAMSGNGFDGKPPLAGTSTWCQPYDGVCGLLWEKCSASEVLKTARTMVSSGLAAKGYTLVLLDDCWSAKTRSADGNLQPDATRFPDGLNGLSQQLGAMGLILGAYTCIGTETCKHGLPGSFGYYEQDAKWLVSQGVKYVKIDNCAKPTQFSERDLYANFSRHLVAAAAARNTTVYVASCEWGAQSDGQPAWWWVQKITNQYRIQMDHLPLFDCPKPLCRAAGAGFGQGTKQIIDYVATMPRWTGGNRSPWGGPNGPNSSVPDPDFLMTMFDKVTMSYTESRTEFSFWALWSAPLICSTSLEPKETIEILGNTAVIAIDRDPLGIPGFLAVNNSNGQPGAQIWLKPLADGGAAVIFFNGNSVWSKATYKIETSWQGLVAPGVVKIAAMDLWAAQPAWTDVSKGYAASLATSDIKMLRLRCTGANGGAVACLQ